MKSDSSRTWALPNSPIVTTSRVIGVDVARAVALMGMVVAHMRDMYVGASLSVDPWYQLVSGRSSALFAALAGLSIVLASSAANTSGQPTLRPNAQSALACRAVLVATIGLLLGAVAEGIAVILTYYGVLFLCALPVLRWRARSLALLAVGWGVAAPILSLMLRPYLPEPSLDIPAPSSLADPLGLLSELLVTGYYPVLTWAAYLFAGMAIGRLDLRSRVVSLRLAVGGALLALVSVCVSALVTRSISVQQSLLDTYDRAEVHDWAELSVVLSEGFFGTTPTGSLWWLAVWSPHSGSIVDLAHTAGCALLILGVALLVTSALSHSDRWAASVIFGAGAMALTLYVVHVLVLALPREWVWAHDIWVHVAVLAGTGAAFACRRSQGPLEWLVSHTSRTVVGAALPTRPEGQFKGR